MCVYVDNLEKHCSSVPDLGFIMTIHGVMFWMMVMIMMMMMQCKRKIIW
jgi:hypothetical protein